MNARMSTSQIWGIPVVIGTLSAIGLLSALLGDGIWDALSWLALAAPVAVTLWCVVRSLHRGRQVVARRA